MQSQRPARAPGVWTWYLVYCGFNLILSLLLIAGSVAVLAGLVDIPERELRDAIPGAWAMMVCGLPAGALYALAFVLPKKPWVWVYHLVLICVGLTSCALLPFCIPLIVFWVKPDVRAWFGRS